MAQVSFLALLANRDKCGTAAAVSVAQVLVAVLVATLATVALLWGGHAALSGADPLTLEAVSH